MSEHIVLWDVYMSMYLYITAQSGLLYSISRIAVSGIELIWFGLVFIVVVMRVYFASKLVGKIGRSLWRRLGFEVLIGIGLSISLQMMKLISGIERPYYALGLGETVNHLDSFSSFPSGHAGLFTYITCVLCGYYDSGWLRALSLVMLVVIVMSRILVGYHYISDVVVGVLLGLVAYRLACR